MDRPILVRYPYSSTHVEYQYYTDAHRMTLPDDIKKQYENYDIDTTPDIKNDIPATDSNR